MLRKNPTYIIHVELPLLGEIFEEYVGGLLLIFMSMFVCDEHGLEFVEKEADAVGIGSFLNTVKTLRIPSRLLYP